MDQKSFLCELQRIQCDLASGVTTLEQVERLLTEEPLPNRYCDMLYIVSTYMQGVHQKLSRCIQTYEQTVPI